MSETRAFEMIIEIAAPPDVVWHAIASAEELVRWFPTEAAVTPGVGGTWLVSWDGNWPWKTEIEIWEPQRHLRLMDRNGRPYDAVGGTMIESVAPMPIALDWYLEPAKGGSTRLRLVHSGFGRGGAWDDEFEGVSAGWPMELNSLKYYLEHHRGENRRVSWTRAVVPGSPETLLPVLLSADGILPDASLLDKKAGDRYAVTLPTGDRLEGTVVIAMPGRGVQLTVDGWNRGLYRLWLDRVGNETSVNAWLSVYGMPDSFVKDFDARMKREVDRRVRSTLPI
jgi:uncharacterized protein YndB with AHSA1/START domain